MFQDNFFDQFNNKQAVVINKVDDAQNFKDNNIVILCCKDFKSLCLDIDADVICYDLSLYRGSNELSYTEIVLLVKDLYTKGIKAAILINNNEILYAYKNVITLEERKGRDIAELAKSLEEQINNRGKIIA